MLLINCLKRPFYRHIAITAAFFALVTVTFSPVGNVVISTANAFDNPPPNDSPSELSEGSVAMKLLIISATDNNNELDALVRYLQLVGTPYDLLVAKDQPLTDSTLINAATGVGNYQSIFLTDAALAYQDDDGNFVSALDADEWQRLWDYEKQYNVRQVALFTYPSTFPEDYGVELNPTDGAIGVYTDPYPLAMTTQGQSIFHYLNSTASIPLSFSFVYRSQLTAGSTAVPLLTDTNGNVLAVESTSTDGRERIALTYSHDAFQIHSQLVMYGLIQWATKGKFIGSRQVYLQADVDDWFQFSDRWNPATGQNDENVFRINHVDALETRRQQRAFNRRYSGLVNDLKLTIAFNGNLSEPGVRSTCNTRKAARTKDPLSAVSKCMKKEFDWLNHTYTEQAMDFVDYPTAVFELSENIKTGKQFGFTMSTTGLVTGSHSGLGIYPENGVVIDHGLEASNPNLLAAAKDTGIKYMAANHSYPSHRVDDCDACGIYHPIDPEVFLIPRYPTNVFYNVTTPAEMVSEYNSIYGPNGSAPFWPNDLTYEEIVDFEASLALLHMITFQPYPHFFHQANLHEYERDKNLVFDWMNRVMDKYKALYSLPVVNLKWDDLGPRVKKLTDFRSADAMGFIDPVKREIHLSSVNGGPVMFTSDTKTSGRGVTNIQYGTEYLGEVETSINGTTIVNY